MKRRILVDTCSFIDYFRGTKSTPIPQLAIHDAILLSQVVRLELIKGARRAERRLLVNFLEGLFCLEDLPTVSLIEETLLQLHGRGINLGLVDIIVLADAARTKSHLMTSDKQLIKAAAVVRVPVFVEK